MPNTQERGRGVPASVLADRRQCSSYISHLLAMPCNVSVSLSRSTNKGQIVPPLFPGTMQALQLIGHSKIKHAEPGQRRMRHYGNDAPGPRGRETSWMAQGKSSASSMADAHRVEAAFVRLKAHASAARSAARIEAFLEPHPGPASLSRLEYRRQREAIAGADAGQGKASRQQPAAPSQCTRPMKRLKLGQESRVSFSWLTPALLPLKKPGCAAFYYVYRGPALRLGLGVRGACLDQAACVLPSAVLYIDTLP